VQADSAAEYESCCASIGGTLDLSDETGYAVTCRSYVPYFDDAETCADTTDLLASRSPGETAGGFLDWLHHDQGCCGDVGTGCEVPTEPEPCCSFCFCAPPSPAPAEPDETPLPTTEDAIVYGGGGDDDDDDDDAQATAGGGSGGDGMSWVATVLTVVAGVFVGVCVLLLGVWLGRRFAKKGAPETGATGSRVAVGRRVMRCEEMPRERSLPEKLLEALRSPRSPRGGPQSARGYRERAPSMRGLHGGLRMDRV
jgi:hypothetical protein